VNDRNQRSLERLAKTVPSHMRSGLDAARTIDLATACRSPTTSDAPS
jgi:hypothetical protein